MHEPAQCSVRESAHKRDAPDRESFVIDIQQRESYYIQKFKFK